MNSLHLMRTKLRPKKHLLPNSLVQITDYEPRFVMNEAGFLLEYSSNSTSQIPRTQNVFSNLFEQHISG